jgi:hypothetical protein
MSAPASARSARPARCWICAGRPASPSIGESRLPPACALLPCRAV